MTLRGKKSITVALCFLNNQGNWNLLLCWALMSWVQRTSQLGFQDFMMCRNRFYFLFCTDQQGANIIAFSPCLSAFGCPSRSRLSFSILQGSFPQSRKHTVSINPPLGGYKIYVAGLNIMRKLKQVWEVSFLETILNSPHFSGIDKLVEILCKPWQNCSHSPRAIGSVWRKQSYPWVCGFLHVLPIRH